MPTKKTKRIRVKTTGNRIGFVIAIVQKDNDGNEATYSPKLLRRDERGRYKVVAVSEQAGTVFKQRGVAARVCAAYEREHNVFAWVIPVGNDDLDVINVKV